MKDKDKLDAALDRIFAYGASRKSDGSQHAAKEKLSPVKQITQNGGENKQATPTSRDKRISKN